MKLKYRKRKNCVIARYWYHEEFLTLYNLDPFLFDKDDKNQQQKVAEMRWKHYNIEALRMLSEYYTYTHYWYLKWKTEGMLRLSRKLQWSISAFWHEVTELICSKHRISRTKSRFGIVNSDSFRIPQNGVVTRKWVIRETDPLGWNISALSSVWES